MLQPALAPSLALALLPLWPAAPGTPGTPGGPTGPDPATPTAPSTDPGAVAPDGPAPARDDLRRPGRRWDGSTRTVHEWGTFTHVQGSDGIGLGGLTHDPFGLPPFVYDLVDRLGLSGASPKMETPVLYFYAPEAWHLSVRVDFPHGLLTQWYPAATRANLWGKAFRPPADLEARMHGEGALERGWLEWGTQGALEVLAPGAEADLPAVEPGDPWRHSREVEANAVRVTNHNHGWLEQALALERGEDVPEEPSIEPRVEDERFLFYRGLGDFPLPLRAEVHADRALAQLYRVDAVLENARPEEPLRDLYLVRVEGDRMGFRALGDLVERLELRDLEVELRPREASDAELAAALVRSLEGTGLFADEARAMVNTWRANWFGDEGLRVLYLLPAPLVERELPLAVEGVERYAPGPDGELVLVEPDPAPEEVVRAFVGRLDLMPPSFEARLVETLAALGSGDAAAREVAEARVRAWGRYREPYLDRARRLGVDASAVERAAALAARPGAEASDGADRESAEVAGGAPAADPSGADLSGAR